MKKLWFLVIFSLSVFVACRDESKAPSPQDLIPKEQFIAILSDIRLLEGAYTTRYSRVDTSALKIESYYLKLFSDHGITAERFNASYAWYASDQPRMLEIEEAVVSKLTAMQSAQPADSTAKNSNNVDSLSKKVKIN
jgi:hypothetical protein